MIVDFNDKNAVLIHYRGGAYGNFLFHVINTFMADTVKIDNNNFTMSKDGNSHDTKKYVQSYELATALLNQKITSYKDYQYVPSVSDPKIWQQIQDGKLFLILCDTSTIDNHTYLLNMWPRAKLIRTYMPRFIDKLVGYANLMQKAGHKPTTTYKNALFDENTIEEMSRDDADDLDNHVVDAMVELFVKDFNLYGKSFHRAVMHDRVFNVALHQLFDYNTFCLTMHQIADFLQTNVIDPGKLDVLWHTWIHKQQNAKYYKFRKNTVTDTDDLIGRALVKFLNT